MRIFVVFLEAANALAWQPMVWNNIRLREGAPAMPFHAVERVALAVRAGTWLEILMRTSQHGLDNIARLGSVSYTQIAVKVS